MPLFRFQVQQGKLPRPFGIEEVLSDNDAARAAALGICADLAKDIVTGLTDDSEWRLEVRNESGQPVVTIRLLVETLEQAVPAIAGA